MDIYSVISLGGGLAFFLFGMHVLSTQLEKLAGGKLEKSLQTMTSSPIKSLALGCGITIAIQSSSALTVMLVGFVNSGIMQLRQAIGVIMGSNIGTTLTAWILGLSGISSNNVFLNLLKPSSFSPVIALAGAIMIMACKRQRKKNIGEAMLGFAVLMYGMQIMSAAVAPLAQSESFDSVLTLLNNPLLGILGGTIFTAIIQSSAASVGVLEALSLTGAISYGMAIPIIMGQNIGTCITALISAFGANRNGKRVAAVHISFNIIGTLIICLLFYPLSAVFNFAFVNLPISPAGIALVHSLFNLLTTMLLLPFPAQLEKLAYLIIPDKNGESTPDLYIDERLLNTPAFAVAECRNLTVKMAHLSKDTFREAMGLMEHFDAEKAERVVENEALIDKFEDKLGSYLVKLSSRQLTDTDSERISELLHTIGDFERISDHAVNILHAAEEMNEKKISFSAEAKAELDVITKAIYEILDITVTSFENNDTSLATRVEPLEQIIDLRRLEIKERHIDRLQRGRCTIELGFILSDIISNFERVSDHCSNIAVCVIQIVDSSSFDTHEYLTEIKSGRNPEFMNDFNYYKDRYVLPSGGSQTAG